MLCRPWAGSTSGGNDFDQAELALDQAVKAAGGTWTPTRRPMWPMFLTIAKDWEAKGILGTF